MYRGEIAKENEGVVIKKGEVERNEGVVMKGAEQRGVEAWSRKAKQKNNLMVLCRLFLLLQKMRWLGSGGDSLS